MLEGLSSPIENRSQEITEAAMKRSFLITALLLFGLVVVAEGQLSTQDAAKGMARGINIGNTMEPPTEGAWGNPPVKQRAFDDYKNAGFTAVRIPITWDGHTSTTSPYTINSTWLNRVEQVVDWGLQRGFLIIMNAHHESWIKNSFTAANVARFDSIWSQIATRFKDRSDSLMFEIINEPNPMSAGNVNALNAQVLQLIRRTNPTRIVVFSGYMWSNSAELVAAAIPDSSDHYLIGYYHSYDPYPFGLVGTGTYGSAADINATKAKFNQVSAWSTRNNIPVILGEFGYIKNCEYNSRMCAYGTVVDLALSYGIPSFTWDDGGDFPMYNRTTGGFNEIKDILIHTYPQSPNGMKISQGINHSVKLQWHNRNTENDSIVIERKVGTDSFAAIAKVASTDSVFVDSSTNPGTSYYYRLSVTLMDSVEIQSYPITLNVSANSVNPLPVPVRFELSDNYPNPFNPTTVIRYAIPEYGMVTLRIYDALGREVETLVNGYQTAGRYEVTVDGSHLPSGVYFYRLLSRGLAMTRKMSLVK
jgi:hypothetical protein